MNSVFAALGLAAGIVVGILTHRPAKKPCLFCGYVDTQTAELYAHEQLDRLLDGSE